MDIIVIGAVGVDTNIYFYTNQIDFDVEANFTQNIDYIGQAGGYSARNLAQLGYKTGFIGHVGDDHNGEWIKQTFKADGIDTLLRIDPMGTKRSINFMYPDGRRKNFYDGKGHMEIKLDFDAVRKMFNRAKIAHFALMNWSRHLLPVAHEMGLTVSVDLQDVVDPHDPYRKDFIEQADILFFSTVNFPDPTPIIKEIQALNRNPEVIIIVGMGKQGCALAVGNRIRFFEPIELDDHPVIDTNGAGDGLAVGFVSSYILEDFPLIDAILRAQINARHICGIKASTDKFLTKNKLDALFEQKRGLLRVRSQHEI